MSRSHDDVHKAPRFGKLGLTVLAFAFASGLAQTGEDADPGDYMVCDFDGQYLYTPLNGYWYTYTDDKEPSAADTTLMGNSRITSLDSAGFMFIDSMGIPDSTSFPVGHDSLSWYSYRFAYALGDRPLGCGDGCTYAPHLGFGLGFTTLNGGIVNLTGAEGIAFWAKAEKGPLVVSISVGTQDTTPNAQDYARKLTIDTAWSLITLDLVPSAEFAQPEWSPYKPFDLTQVKSMGFSFSRADNDSLTENALLIDDLVILGWEYVEPEAGIGFQRWPKAANTRFSVERRGALTRVKLPAAYDRMSGDLEAVDSRGRILARESFSPGAGEVSLRLPSGDIRGDVFFRVRSSQKSEIRKP